MHSFPIAHPMLVNNFLNTATQSAYFNQKRISELSLERNFVGRIVGGIVEAFEDIAIDTLKTPLQSVEHAKNAIEQLFYARTSGLGYKNVNLSKPNYDDPSKYSIKGSLFYAQEAVSQAVFTLLTCSLIPIKFAHQIGGHFFYTTKTHSIGLSKIDPIGTTRGKITEKTEPAWGWDPMNKTDNNKMLTKWQDDLYSRLRKNSSHLPCRIISPLIAFIDVVLDTVSPLIETVRTVCLTVGHLFGALTWQKNCSLRKVIVHTDLTFFRASQTISAIVFILPKFLQKTCAILYDPAHAYSIRAFSSHENGEDYQENGKEAVRLIYV